jgi:NADPH:quinone reductase-like Zn-dependent oxidoreductase
LQVPRHQPGFTERAEGAVLGFYRDGCWWRLTPAEIADPATLIPGRRDWKDNIMTVAPVLVTGAAGGIQGSTGLHVTRLLLDKGAPVRAFVHRLDERSDRLRTLGAEVVDGDLRDFRSVAAATAGIRRAYFAYPVQEGLLEAAATFAASARATGVEQVVNLSQWLQPGGE